MVKNGVVPMDDYLVTLFNELDANQILVYKTTGYVEINNWNRESCENNIIIYKNLIKFLEKEKDSITYELDPDSYEEEFYFKKAKINNNIIDDIPHKNQISIRLNYGDETKLVEMDIIILSQNTKSIKKIIGKNTKSEEKFNSVKENCKLQEI